MLGRIVESAASRRIVHPPVALLVRLGGGAHDFLLVSVVRERHEENGASAHQQHVLPRPCGRRKL